MSVIFGIAIIGGSIPIWLLVLEAARRRDWLSMASLWPLAFFGVGFGLWAIQSGG